jgi:hypothetical protein
MHTPQHYREMAERYAAQAMRASDPEVRAMLTDMVRYTLSLAEQAAAEEAEKERREKLGGG